MKRDNLFAFTIATVWAAALRLRIRSTEKMTRTRLEEGKIDKTEMKMKAKRRKHKQNVDGYCIVLYNAFVFGIGSSFHLMEI